MPPNEVRREPSRHGCDRELLHSGRCAEVHGQNSILGSDMIDKTIHPHPTLGESIGIAAEVA